MEKYFSIQKRYHNRLLKKVNRISDKLTYIQSGGALTQQELQALDAKKNEIIRKIETQRTEIDRLRLDLAASQRVQADLGQVQADLGQAQAAKSQTDAKLAANQLEITELNRQLVKLEEYINEIDRQLP